VGSVAVLEHSARSGFDISFDLETIRVAPDVATDAWYWSFAKRAVVPVRQ